MVLPEKTLRVVCAHPAVPIVVTLRDDRRHADLVITRILFVFAAGLTKVPQSPPSFRLFLT
jgi:hypothetical protein